MRIKFSVTNDSLYVKALINRPAFAQKVGSNSADHIKVIFVNVYQKEQLTVLKF